MNTEAAIRKVNEIIGKKYDRTFIFNFNSRSTLYDFQEKLLMIIDNFIDVSDYCIDDDSFSNLSKLVPVCSHLNQPSVLRGLDRCFAIQSNFDKSAIYGTLLKPFHSVGAPLFILSWNSDAVLSDLMAKDLRCRDFIYFVENESPEVDFSIVIFSNDIDCPTDCYPNYRSLLKSFEKDPPKTRYFLKTNINPDLFAGSHVQIYYIDSYKSLTHLFEPDIEFIGEGSFDYCWRNYNIDYPGMNLEEVYTKCFSGMDLSESLQSCVEDNFRLWILLSYCKNKSIESSNIYFDYVINKVNTLDEFNDEIVYGLLNLDSTSLDFSEYYADRKLLLSQFKYYSPQEYVEHVLGSKDMPERIAYLTDLTIPEKEMVFESLSDYGTINNRVLDLLYVVYRDLWYYLDDLSGTNFFDIDYFTHYRELKVLNKKPDQELMEVVNNSYDHYAKYDSRNSVFNQFMKKTVDHIFFFDALGVEYIALFKHLCKEKGLKVDCRVCKAVFPTITSENTSILKDYESLVQNEKSLDKIYHNQVNLSDSQCSSSKYIVRVLDSIRNAVATIAETIKVNQKLLVYSDHGASRMYVLNGQEDTIDWKGVESNHNGRCAKIGNSKHEPDPRVRVEEKYYVAKAYSRFAGIQKAKVESHGGCTLEESIVPLMLVSINDNGKRRKITVKNKDSKVISDPLHSEAILEIIYPIKSSKVYIQILGEDYQYVDSSNNVYKFNLFEIPVSSKPIEVSLFDSDDLIDSFDITIQKAGVKQNKMFGLF